ncbi:hypothetical protein PROFUN_04635 [Planoprotostelium fungivorum]|uniref:Uncharacterized protein n=1 Tax=Planoprotostelium fungivorum TaxID=1890364 RepID=A0A2P6NUS2_9EUKA|nr:hypothetical protein PROFUN_04635 [Planoprotostelium fungivorum]
MLRGVGVSIILLVMMAAAVGGCYIREGDYVWDLSDVQTVQWTGVPETLGAVTTRSIQPIVSPKINQTWTISICQPLDVDLLPNNQTWCSPSAAICRGTAINGTEGETVAEKATRTWRVSHRHSTVQAFFGERAEVTVSCSKETIVKGISSRGNMWRVHLSHPAGCPSKNQHKIIGRNRVFTYALPLGVSIVVCVMLGVYIIKRRRAVSQSSPASSELEEGVLVFNTTPTFPKPHNKVYIPVSLMR